MPDWEWGGIITYDEHLMKLRFHQDIFGTKLKMKEPICVEISNSLAGIEKITEKTDQRHVGSLVLTIM
jgi:hypothetical protein